ncbi:MAG: hypothetical protein ACSHYB_13815 [Roseibacillus sp.]
MSRIKLPIILLSLLATLAPSLLAQDLRPVECRFLALDERPDSILNAVGENKDIKVSILKNRISEPIECIAVNGRLNFIDGQSREPLASTPIPAKIKKAIIIFVEVPDQKKWFIVPFEDSAEQFPKGGTHVVNLHSDDIRFILGESKEVLPPRKTKGFEMPEKRNEFNMAPVVFQFKNKKDEWVNGKETAYRFLPAIRYLLIAYIDPNNNRPRVKTFKDTFRPRPPAE